MPTIKYTLPDGSSVPGVTTVIGKSLGWSKDALIWWAWNEGINGRNYRDSRQSAADAGTMAHAMVEACIREETWVPPPDAPEDQLRLASLSYDAWKEWIAQSRIKFVEVEPHLISTVQRFGGTPDAIGRLKGQLCLLDWKTSKGIYSEYVIQLAAYQHLWDQNRDEHITGGIHCARFDKSTGGFSHHWWPSEALRPAWEAFLRLRDLYDLERQMKALAA